MCEKCKEIRRTEYFILRRNKFDIMDPSESIGRDRDSKEKKVLKLVVFR